MEYVADIGFHGFYKKNKMADKMAAFLRKNWEL
jgi:hypothetical protein